MLAVLGAAGGVTVFLGGVGTLLWGVFRLIDATRDNTLAIEKLTGRVDGLVSQQDTNTRDIADLKRARRRTGR